LSVTCSRSVVFTVHSGFSSTNETHSFDIAEILFSDIKHHIFNHSINHIHNTCDEDGSERWKWVNYDRDLFLLAHLAKGNVSFCHHLASDVCRPLTFHILIFSSETARPIDLKFGRKHLWKVLYKIAHFIPIH
jgi:hypothetical protein